MYECIYTYIVIYSVMDGWLNLAGYKWSFLYVIIYSNNILLPHKDDIVYNKSDLILSSTLTKRMVE